MDFAVVSSTSPSSGSGCRSRMLPDSAAVSARRTHSGHRPTPRSGRLAAATRRRRTDRVSPRRPPPCQRADPPLRRLETACQAGFDVLPGTSDQRFLSQLQQLGVRRWRAPRQRERRGRARLAHQAQRQDARRHRQHPDQSARATAARIAVARYRLPACPSSCRSSAEPDPRSGRPRRDQSAEHQRDSVPLRADVRRLQGETTLSVFIDRPGPHRGAVSSRAAAS